MNKVINKLKNYKKNTSIKNVSNNDGLASVLVLLVMLAILAIGLVILLQLKIDKGMSNKSTEWNGYYYDLDGKAQTSLYNIENALSEAEYSAINYMNTREYESKKAVTVPQVIQDRVYEDYSREGDKNFARKNTLNVVYAFFANAKLEELYNSEDNMKIYKYTESGLIKSISIELNYTGDINKDKKMVVKLEVEPLNYEIKSSDKTITYTKKDTDKFIVQEYAEKQSFID